MKLEEIKNLFRYCEGKDIYCEHEGNQDFGRILSTSLDSPPGTVVELAGGQKVEFMQLRRSHDRWNDHSEGVFKINDTFFSVSGDADSWDGIPDYTTPSSIRLVKPTDKTIVVYEEIEDESN